MVSPSVFRWSELTNLKSEKEIHGNESNVLRSTNWTFFSSTLAVFGAQNRCQLEIPNVQKRHYSFYKPLG